MKKDISEASNELLKTGLAYSKSADLLADARAIIDAAQKSAYRSVNAALVYRNWLLGRRIAEEDLGGEARAEYGKSVIENLAVDLTAIYGKGFDFGSLYKFIAFYRRFPILDSLSPKCSGTRGRSARTYTGCSGRSPCRIRRSARRKAA